MKNLKKFLALLLVLCMLTSMLGTAVFAATEGENGGGAPQTTGEPAGKGNKTEGEIESTPTPAPTAEQTEDGDEQEDREKKSETVPMAELVPATKVEAPTADNGIAPASNELEPRTSVSGDMTAADFLAAAVNGVISLDGDVNTTEQIDITENLTLNGNGYTLTYTNSTNAETHISALHVYGATVAINDLNIVHNTGAALVVNHGANVTVNGLTTSAAATPGGHFWGGVNVDGSTFAATGLTCNEDAKVWTEGTVTVNVPGYVAVYGVDGEKVHYTTEEAAEANELVKAKADGKYYSSVQAAIDTADKGKIVTLLRDTAENLTIANGQDITLEIPVNVTLSNNGKSHTIVVEHGGELNVVGDGVIANANNKAVLFNSGKAVLSGATITCTSTAAERWYIIVNHGDMTIEKNGKVIAETKQASMIQNGYGSYNCDNANNGYVAGQNYEFPTLTITGGEARSIDNTAIKNEDGGILEVSGDAKIGTDKTGYFALTNFHVATISGGSFTGPIYFAHLNDTINKGILTITDGKFTNDSGHNFQPYDEASCAYVGIFGGTFGGSCPLGGECTHNGAWTGIAAVANGYLPKDNGDGTYTVRERVPGTLTTDIGSKTFVTGQATEFTFSTVANDDAGTTVIGASNFSDEEAIAKLEYQVGDQWVEYPRGEAFGGSGFPMSDATSTFRVTFAKAGDYTFTASMKTAGSGDVLCSTAVSFTVKEAVAEVNTVKYATLQEAVAAANSGDTITLLADIDLGEDNGITLNKKVTIDGDGHTVTGTGVKNYNDGLINFEGGSEGSELKDLIINYTATGAQRSAVYFGYGFTGGSASNVTKLTNVTIDGANSDGSISNVIGVSSTYITGGYVTVSGCTLKNLKYGMYFNAIHDLTLQKNSTTNNTITNTLYNAINLAGDNAEYPSSNITIRNVDMTKIATAKYPDDRYSSGIRIGLYVDESEREVILGSISFVELAGKVQIFRDAVAEVNGTKYASIADAIAAAGSSDTVKLLRNVTESVTVPAGKTVTLDLNGKTLTNKGVQHTITNRGTLTVTGSGTVDNVSHGKAAIFNDVGGAAILNGGTFTRSAEEGTSVLGADGKWTNSANGNSYYTVLNHGTMTINAGVTVSQNGSFSSLIDNGAGAPADAAPELTVNGGTFKGGKISLKNEENCTLTVNDGTFTNANNWSVTNYGVMNIGGGSFTCARSGLYNGKGTLTVTDGTFNYALDGVYEADGSTVAVSGGTFSKNVSEYCVAGKLAYSADSVWTVKDYAPGAVTAYGGGTVDRTDLSNVTVTFDSRNTLVFSATGNDYGRTPNRWWAGINVKADVKTDIANARYQKIGAWWLDGGASVDWGNSTADGFQTGATASVQADGQYWAMVSPEYMDRFKGADKQLMYRYAFDWNGDGANDQFVTIIVKDDVKYDPAGLKGTVAAHNGAPVSGDSVTYGAGTTLSFTAEDNAEGPEPNHWWAGIRVTAPEGASLNAKYQVTRRGTASAAESWGADRDRRYWELADQAYIDSEGTGDPKTLVYTYQFDWDGDGVYDQTFTMNVQDGITLAQAGAVAMRTSKGSNFYYGTLADALAAAASGDTVTLLKSLTVNSTASDGEAAIAIPNGVTLDGNGNTITAGTFAHGAHMLGVVGISDEVDVTIRNLTVDMAHAAHSGNALNVRGAMAQATLENLTLKNANAAGLVVGGRVTASGLATSGNTGGAVDVDGGSILTITDGSIAHLAEDNKVRSGDYGQEGGSQITVQDASIVYGMSDGKVHFTTDEAARKVAVAQIYGTTGVYYATLQSAVDACPNSGTVNLINDVTDGSGVTVGKSLTIDFRGRHYTVAKDPVGSAGFRLPAGGSTVRMVNGYIHLPGATANLSTGIRNSANLTLDGVTIDAGANSNITCVLSSSNGSTAITGGTKLLAPADGVALGVYGDGSGEGSVRVADAASPCPKVEVTGKVEVSNAGNAKLAISGGIFSREIETGWCAEGFLPVENADGTYGVSDTLALDRSAIRMTVGSTTSSPETLTVTTATTAAVTWTSSSAAVATVDANGVVTPRGAGTATITASVNGVTAACEVTVTQTSTPPYIPPTPPVTDPDDPEEDLDDPDVPLAGLPFIDVHQTDWFYGAVSTAYLRELMIGITATEFAPEAPTNRGSVATILHRMENTPDAEMSDFSDVMEGQWYTPAINWTNQVGVMIGYDTGVFLPEAGITREQLALTFFRYRRMKGMSVDARADLSTFADADRVSGWAREAMEWAVGCGLLKGTTENSLVPQGLTKRSELATVLQRFLEMD